MTHRFFLHVGPPKTGTTYLQGLLDANREALRAAGCEVVGTHDEHFRAANELMGRPGRRGESVPEGAWAHVQRLVEGVKGDGVASCERYSMLSAPEAARVGAGLSGRHELHVVATLRDPTVVLPGQWQEHVKNGADISWDEFCRRVVDEPKFRARMTRVRRVLRAWAGVVPTGHLHVVTVPPPGTPRQVLRDRFCTVLGIDPAVLADEAATSNESVDLVGAELIRRLNRASSLSPDVQHTEIKGFLVPEVLARQDHASPPRLTGRAFEAARAEGDRQSELVRAAGHPVVGDLDDLRALPPAEHQDDQEVSDQQVSELAVRSVAALAERSFELQNARARGLRARAARARAATGRLVRRFSRPAGRS